MTKVRGGQVACLAHSEAPADQNILVGIENESACCRSGKRLMASHGVVSRDLDQISS